MISSLLLALREIDRFGLMMDDTRIGVRLGR